MDDIVPENNFKVLINVWKSRILSWLGRLWHRTLWLLTFLYNTGIPSPPLSLEMEAAGYSEYQSRPPWKPQISTAVLHYVTIVKTHEGLTCWKTPHEKQRMFRTVLSSKSCRCLEITLIRPTQFGQWLAMTWVARIWFSAQALSFLFATNYWMHATTLWMELFRLLGCYAL